MTYLSPIIRDIEALAVNILKDTPDIAYSDYEKVLFTETNALLEHIKKRALESEKHKRDRGSSLDKDKASKFHVTVIGAGSAGLLSAYTLAKHGFSVTLYEKRSKPLSTLRYPNISFKEATKTLKPMLGDRMYQSFLETGGSMDGKTGKLRLTIGRFQEILLDELDNFSNVTIHFNQFFSFDNEALYEKTDLILIATGAHAAREFSLEAELSIHRFPDYDAKGITALYIQASDAPHGYFRKDIEGYHWRRDNKSVYSGKAFSYDIKRVTHQLDDETVKQSLLSLTDKKGVEYTFSFGNDTPQFFHNPPLTIEPILLARYDVKPQIALTPLFHKYNKTIIALGDANGTPHPLAAIGTLKFVRNVIHLHTYVTEACHIKLTDKGDKETQYAGNDAWYVNEAMKNIEEVFFANLFSSIYSRPRGA